MFFSLSTKAFYPHKFLKLRKRKKLFTLFSVQLYCYVTEAKKEEVHSFSRFKSQPESKKECYKHSWSEKYSNLIDLIKNREEKRVLQKTHVRGWKKAKWDLSKIYWITILAGRFWNKTGGFYLTAYFLKAIFVLTFSPFQGHFSGVCHVLLFLHTQIYWTPFW